MAKLLIIDNGHRAPGILKASFEDEGHEVDIARTPKQVRDFLQANADPDNAYDVICLDATIGNGKVATGDSLGPSLLRLIRQMPGYGKVTVLGGYVSSDETRDAAGEFTDHGIWNGNKTKNFLPTRKDYTGAEPLWDVDLVRGALPSPRVIPALRKLRRKHAA